MNQLDGQKKIGYFPWHPLFKREVWIGQGISFPSLNSSEQPNVHPNKAFKDNLRINALPKSSRTGFFVSDFTSESSFSKNLITSLNVNIKYEGAFVKNNSSFSSERVNNIFNNSKSRKFELRYINTFSISYTSRLEFTKGALELLKKRNRSDFTDAYGEYFVSEIIFRKELSILFQFTANEEQTESSIKTAIDSATAIGNFKGDLNARMNEITKTLSAYGQCDTQIYANGIGIDKRIPGFTQNSVNAILKQISKIDLANNKLAEIESVILSPYTVIEGFSANYKKLPIPTIKENEMRNAFEDYVNISKSNRYINSVIDEYSNKLPPEISKEVNKYLSDKRDESNRIKNIAINNFDLISNSLKPKILPKFEFKDPALIRWGLIKQFKNTATVATDYRIYWLKIEGCFFDLLHGINAIGSKGVRPVEYDMGYLAKDDKQIERFTRLDKYEPTLFSKPDMRMEVVYQIIFDGQPDTITFNLNTIIPLSRVYLFSGNQTKLIELKKNEQP